MPNRPELGETERDGKTVGSRLIRLQPGQSHRQPARSGRSTSTTTPAPRPPGRRGHPGLALPRGVRRLPPCVGGAGRQKPASRDWAASATTLRAPANAATDEPVASTQSSFGDQAIKEGWTSRPAAESVRAGRRCRTVGCRRLMACGASVTASIHEAGPMTGGMMRFGIPAGFRATCRRRGHAHRGDGRRSACTARSTTSRSR
jgi:hypothetical protein